MNIRSIGTIHAPWTSLRNMPIRPKGDEGTESSVELLTEFADGLTDLAGFNHSDLLSLFHKAPRTQMSVIPFMETVKHGVFSTRSPLWSTHIGLSIIRLVSVKKNTSKGNGVDILDGTPLLDVKSWRERFDRVIDPRNCWMKSSADDVAAKRSDSRFI